MDNVKKILIVANWKSNMTESEAKFWLENFSVQASDIVNKMVVVCPPFTLLSDLKSFFTDHKSPIVLGAQDISPMDQEACTGGVSGKQLKEFADFVIVGHSERRRNFSENEEVVNAKIDQAFKYGLTAIACVSDLEQADALQKFKGNPQLVIAYEPLFAVGSGTPDKPDNADRTAGNIKNILGDVPILYGGSVTSGNICDFLKMPNIGGALVGKASLDPAEFLQIIKNA
jgi:triosephosphate isomerase (TIM)